GLVILAVKKGQCCCIHEFFQGSTLASDIQDDCEDAIWLRFIRENYEDPSIDNETTEKRKMEEASLYGVWVWALLLGGRNITQSIDFLELILASSFGENLFFT
ncbi:hypothetical protein ACJX0J_027538, partial [Zea mays]